MEQEGAGRGVGGESNRTSRVSEPLTEHTTSFKRPYMPQPNPQPEVQQATAHPAPQANIHKPPCVRGGSPPDGWLGRPGGHWPPTAAHAAIRPAHTRQTPLQLTRHGVHDQGRERHAVAGVTGVYPCAGVAGLV